MPSAPMLAAVDAFPRQLKQGLDAGADVGGDTPSSVLLAGMGGSGIGGALAQAWLASTAHAPIVVWREEVAPAYLEPDDLVIAVSYSGGTGETLSVARGAVERHARLVAVTTGGPLAELARKHDAPIVKAPAGMQPRSALGFLFGAITGVLEANRTITGAAAEVAAAAKVLDGFPQQLRSDPGSPVKPLSERLGPGHVDVVGHDLMGIAARRFATQMDENAKVPAGWHILPEAMHNAVVPWSFGAKYSRLALLRREKEDPLERARFEHLLDESQVADVVEVRVPGTGIEQALRAILIGDVASILLADRLGRDPEAVETIARLKDRLRKLGSG